jgi:hypothetical protein
MAPEVQLFMKARDTRSKDDADFATVASWKNSASSARTISENAGNSDGSRASEGRRLAEPFLRAYAFRPRGQLAHPNNRSAVDRRTQSHASISHPNWVERSDPTN